MKFNVWWKMITENINDEKDLVKINRGIDSNFASISFSEKDGQLVYHVKDKKTQKTLDFEDLWDARAYAFELGEKYINHDQQEDLDDQHSQLNIGQTGYPFGQGWPGQIPDDEDEFKHKVMHVSYIQDADYEEIEAFDEKVEKQIREIFPWLNNINLHGMRVADVIYTQWNNKFNDQQLQKLIQYMNYIESERPNSIENSELYPLYVTLYDRTRILIGSYGYGGDDGVYGDHLELIQSIQVKNKSSIERVAESLFAKAMEMEFDGIPYIVVELEKGGSAQMEEDRNRRIAQDP